MRLTNIANTSLFLTDNIKGLPDYAPSSHINQFASSHCLKTCHALSHTMRPKSPVEAPTMLAATDREPRRASMRYLHGARYRRVHASVEENRLREERLEDEAEMEELLGRGSIHLNYEGTLALMEYLHRALSAVSIEQSERA
ncbi:hypothetical protein BST61_g6852 [Cercospora zeina]